MFKDYLFTAEKLRSHIFNQIYLPTCPARQPLLTPPSGIFRQPLPFFPLEFSPGGGARQSLPRKIASCALVHHLYSHLCPNSPFC